MSFKEVLVKNANDPNSAVNEIKNTLSKYQKELEQKVAKDNAGVPQKAEKPQAKQQKGKQAVQSKQNGAEPANGQVTQPP